MANFTDLLGIIDVYAATTLAKPDDVTAFRDLVPPTLSVFTPPAGDITQTGQVFEVTVTDNLELSYFRVELESLDGIETVYAHDTGIAAGYTGTKSSSSSGHAISVTRADPLPYGAVTMRVLAIDRGGNVLQQARGYTVPGHRLPPAIEDLSPPAASSLPVDGSVSFRIVGVQSPLVHVQIVAATEDETEVVYDPDLGESANYVLQYDHSNPNEFVVTTLRRTSGWRGSAWITISARDAAGESVQAQYYYVGEGADVDEPPYVFAVEPAPGAYSKDTPITLSIFHPSGLSEIVWLSITGLFEDAGVQEVLWQSEAFGPAYKRLSTLSRHGGGIQFSLRRTGGWYRGRLALTIAGVDKDGQLIREFVFTGGGG